MNASTATDRDPDAKRGSLARGGIALAQRRYSWGTAMLLVLARVLARVSRAGSPALLVRATPRVGNAHTWLVDEATRVRPGEHAPPPELSIKPPSSRLPRVLGQGSTPPALYS